MCAPSRICMCKCHLCIYAVFEYGLHSLYVMPTLYSPYYCTSRTVIILTPLGTQILMFQTQSAKVRSVHLCSSSVLFTGSEDGRITRLVAVSVYLCIYVYVWLCGHHSDPFIPSLIALSYNTHVSDKFHNLLP